MFLHSDEEIKEIIHSTELAVMDLEPRSQEPKHVITIAANSVLACFASKIFS